MNTEPKVLSISFASYVKQKKTFSTTKVCGPIKMASHVQKLNSLKVLKLYEDAEITVIFHLFSHQEDKTNIT